MLLGIYKLLLGMSFQEMSVVSFNLLQFQLKLFLSDLNALFPLP